MSEIKIEPAFFHKEDLQKKYAKEIFKEKYKFSTTSCYQNFELDISKESWSKEQFVVLCEKEVVGYLSASINRETDSISQLFIVDFTDRSEEFAQAMSLFFHSFLLRFKKITFSVVVGNSTEKFYDKLVDFPEFNGRIVGVFKNDVKLSDGKLYDQKWYEFSKEKI
jgi:hypothetical protein